MRNVFVSHLSAKIDPTPLRFFELQIFYIYFIHFTRLVGDMGTSAIALSLLFSCVLGLLSSMTSSTMETIRLVICSNSVFICRDLRTCFLRPGKKHYNIEYPCETKVIARYIIFSHIFYFTFGYNATQIHINPVLSILLATFAGCGVVMCASSVLVEVLRLRRRWLARSNNQTDSEPILH
ncbi:hypothetical protein HanHA300_Chr14g0535121 [Helianthus annuus]|nr:hypothetical protein HanHA300_Chr14g0535121 [Helianthus annuus]KAJ0486736.1 hypothetical protein HanHA89_Chr14g0582911 [Helianthus annuus]KAJ0660869.1 hypothetical protein HanOQP8_Chr14g0542481 [Helianthus annuus]